MFYPKQSGKKYVSPQTHADTGESGTCSHYSGKWSCIVCVHCEHIKRAFEQAEPVNYVYTAI